MFKRYILGLFEHIYLINCDENVQIFYNVIEAAQPHELRTWRWPYNPLEYYCA
jgi:hypothetical protein